MTKQVSVTQKALNVWAIILIIWAIYRAKFRMPEWFDEFIAKPLVFILPVYLFICKIEKKKFFASIDLKFRLSLSDLLIVLVIGGITATSAVLANFIKFGKLVFFQQTFSLQNLLLILLMALATGISEEILSRGFILKKLYEESKNIYTSSFFASVLFFFLHIPILFTSTRFNGNVLLMFLATDMILSLVNSFIYLERKNLVLPILIHTFYNLSIILFL